MESDQEVGYVITVEGTLNPEWSGWFDRLTVTEESGSVKVTVLTGSLDQSALRGVLNKIWDLNLTLISVVACDAQAPGN
jgi:hypothetical protein